MENTGQTGTTGPLARRPDVVAPYDLPELGGYVQRLRRPLRAGLLIGFLVPLIAMAFYFHFHLNLTLTQSGKLQLTNLAESQRNTIDLFLQERVVNILNLLQAGGREKPPGQAVVDTYLQRLRETNEALVDVGFLDTRGIQNGYAGPYPYLRGKDYSTETWFRRLMDREQSCTAAGSYCYLYKPCRTEELIDIVREAFLIRAIRRLKIERDKLTSMIRQPGGESSLAAILRLKELEEELLEEMRK